MFLFDDGSSKVYNNLTDEQIIALTKTGDKHALDFLLDKHKKLVKQKARAYFIMGADGDDIIQEGMIGLYKAVNDYDDQKKVPFISFAGLCIERQILTAIKNAARQKHSPLNSYISLSADDFDAESELFLSSITGKYISSPEEMIINRETKKIIETNIEKVLSKMERNAISLYLNGASYEEIANALGKGEKAVDNAIQRVRRKMSEQWAEISE
ncbi:MAG: RNA polymerase sporulation sigma factor SigH [Defluviitaleaceae bacterium]|nr:RNA polymerase sporulation sigma factor SigH [Defluviitaleaceae bacterium]